MMMIIAYFFLLCLFLVLFLLHRHGGVILKFKTIPLGSLRTLELTILEYKPLFSLKLFYFEPGEAQELFHTHSFTAYSFLIYGNYMERFFDPKTRQQYELPRNRSRIIHIAKDRFHQITRSSGCLTLMGTGPWGDTYKEYDPKTSTILVSTHGRRLVESHPLLPVS